MNTGIIALNVTDGSGIFTFNITSAPEGVPTGIVTPNKNGTLYTFAGENYPSGDYVVRVEDGCYTSIATFTLGEITGFPTFSSSSYSGFRPMLTNNSCNSVYWNAGSVSNSNPDYYRYYTDGMYEVGAAPEGEIPTNWVPWTSYTLTLNLSPYTYLDFYTPNKISVYTRIKGCDDAHTSITTYMKKPTLTSSTAHSCDKYSYTVRPWTDYDGLFCYPLSLVVTQTSGTEAGTVIVDKSNLSNPVSEALSLDYGTSYNIKFTDINGTTATSNITPSRSGLALSYTDNTCSSQYTLTYSTNYPCYPIEVTIKDSDGNIVHSRTMTSSSYNSVLLDYGTAYTIEAIYTSVNADPPYKYTSSIKRTSTIPTSYSMSLSTPSNSNCFEDRGYLYISRNGSGFIPAGTTFTVTGPDGYVSQTTTSSSTSSTTGISLPTTLPAGVYTATIVNGCGDPTPMTATLTLNGIYSGKALSYTTENTCSGMKITPSGSMTYQGNPITTYYRLVDGPTGYDKTVITPGKSFTFSTPGRYILGILNTNSATGCVIKQDTINYIGSPLSLNQTGTSAYECVDNITGIILLKAENGVAPYTYQLWDKSNTTKLIDTDLVSAGQVHFNYGQADSTYTARIIDQCGNMFSQQITMAKLSTARIVYASDNNVCSGDTIELKCITLGNTAYNWRGPNGFTSTI